MKIFSAPEHIKVPAFDADFDNYLKDVEKYKAELKAWLAENGYDGVHTGEVIYFPVADGKAQYMLAESGRSLSLIHLGDICADYHYDGVQFMPKREILKRLEQQKRVAALFSRK